MILLDSDVLIDLLRGRAPALAWLSSCGGRQVVVPGFVAMEVILGCRDAADLAATERELRNYQVVWPSAGECEQAVRLLSRYRLSSGLGLIDALVAQTALSVGEPLHTFNVKHFRVVPGLRTVQPYTKP